jgi:hypothetical protein
MSNRIQIIWSAHHMCSGVTNWSMKIYLTNCHHWIILELLVLYKKKNANL